MKKILILSAALISLFTCLFTQAEPKFYQVELIIFKRINPPPPGSDLWSSEPAKPKLNNTVTLHTDAANPDKNFQLLPKRDFKLMPEDRALRKSYKYKILMHIAWLQAVASPRDTPSIHIVGGQFYNPNDANIQTDDDGYWQIDGTIKIGLARYFDVNTKLFFTAPTSEYAAYVKSESNNNFQSALTSFRMFQKRRTKSNELNYFDHPLFGMLLKIIPTSDQNVALTQRSAVKENQNVASTQRSAVKENQNVALTQ